MSAGPIKTEPKADSKSVAESLRPTSARATGASRSARVSYGPEDTPAVSMRGASATGQRPPRSPSPTQSTRGPVAAPSSSRAGTGDPVFTVADFAAGGSGNAILRPGADMYAESPVFRSVARVAAPRGAATAQWDIGYIQTAVSHVAEFQHKHTTEHIPVSVPIRDAVTGTPEPWYDRRVAARPGADSIISMSDQPDIWASWNDPRTGERNSLTRIIRRFGLVSWLVARHRVRRTIIFLKNIAWGFHFIINANSRARTASNAGPGMQAPVTGNGQGSVSPRLSGPIYNTALASATPIFAARGAAPRTPATSSSQPATPVQLSTSPAPAMRGPMSPEVTKLVSNPSGGTPLPDSVRVELERTLDIPLSPVRVHADAQTGAIVDSTGARAFTYGLHIYLGSRERVTDLNLMAHEITHVVQQQGQPVLQMYSGPSTGDAFEHEAHQVAGAVQRKQRAVVERRTGGARVQGLWPVSEIVDWIEDRAWDLVNRFAPGLIPIIRRGPLTWIKEKIVVAVEAIVDTVMAPVRAITGLASSLHSHFSNLLTWLRDAAAKIARGDCSSLTEAAHKIQQVFEGIAAPIIDRIKHVARRVKEFFVGLWDRFGAPVWAFLRRVGGAVWERIQSLGSWIWNITAPIRRALARAWQWIKNRLGIGEGPEGQNGILQWVQRKAHSAWDNYILPFIERFKRPLQIVGLVLAMLSPVGPFLAIGAIAFGVIRGVQAIRQYFGTRGGIVNGRSILQNEIIPGIVNTINRVASWLREKAQFVVDKLNSIVSGLGNAASAVAGTIIGFIARGLSWLAERFGELVNWAMDHLMGLANWVGNALQRLVAFLRPVLDFLRRVAAVVRNILRLAYEFGARIWNAIPACIRDPFIDFFIPLILRQIPFFSELGNTPEAWQQTRASIMLLVRQIFRDFDLWGAMRTAFGIVVRALRIPIDLVQQLLEKASRAWDAVLAAPIRFIRSALQAILRGVGRFIGSFLTHLWNGVQGWLFNAVSDRGITPPSSWFDLRAVFGFVLNVLGISLDHVLDLLARRIGQPAVARIRTMLRVLTGAWEWVSVAIREGPAGLWRMLVDRLSNLGRMVLESAVQWVMGRIFAIVGARLTALAASAGLSAILEAVVAVYQAVRTAIEYARRILQIFITVFDTVIQIAQGVIDPAAQMVERGLDMAMPVVIGFLANYAGLGGIGNRIREIIDDVRARVDAGILWLIDRALAAGRWLLDRLRAGAAAVAEWWKTRKQFRTASGQQHTLYFRGRGASAQLMIQSEVKTYAEFVNNIVVPATLQNFKNRALVTARRIDALKAADRTTGIQPAEIQERLDELAIYTAPLADSSPTNPPSVIEYGPLNEDDGGTFMNASILSRNRVRGSAPQDMPRIMRMARRRPGSSPQAPMYIQGHLLNNNLGGPGRAYNLTPITGVAFGGAGNANRMHLDSVERFIKPIVDAGDVICYRVTVNYGRHSERPLQAILRTRIQTLRDRMGTPQAKPTDNSDLGLTIRKLEIMDYEQNHLARALVTEWSYLKYDSARGAWVPDRGKAAQPIIPVLNVLPLGDFTPIP